MNDPERLNCVADILRGHTGAENGVTIAVIEKLAGFLNRRSCEQFLELNIDELPFPVCSGSKGYYVPVTAEELNHYLNSLQSRAVCIFIRKRRVIKKALRHGWQRDGKKFRNQPQQMSLL